MKRKCLNKLVALLITGSLLAGNLGLTAMAEEIDSQGEVTEGETIAEETVAEEGIVLAADGVIASGVDGDLTWSISSAGVLTVSGNGDYEINDSGKWSPDWVSYSDSITSAVIAVNGITNMECMFYGCSALENVDFSNSDTSDVTSTAYMFWGCESLTGLDLSSFNTSNVTDMSYMFCYCEGIISLDFSGFDTGNVKDMSGMFYGCSAKTLDLSCLDTSNVTDMMYMFGYSEVEHLNLSGIDTGNVTSMQYMFWNCYDLVSLDLSGVSTSNVTNMNGMFCNCSSLTSLDVSEFDTGNVIAMSFMFSGCAALTSLDVSNFNTSNVQDMYGMFTGCSGLTSLDVSHFDTSNVSNMSSMFKDCSGLTSLDVSGFDTSGLEDEYDVISMFAGCKKLTTLTVSAYWSVPVDLPSVDGTYWVDGNGDVCESVASGVSAVTTYTRLGEAIESVEDVFSDIVSGSWYVSAVQYVYNNGLMSGKGEGVFDPNGKITRAEFVTTLYSMQSKPEVIYDTTFSDVPSGQWYTSPVMWASEETVVSGYANGKFGVSDAITREQLALMLYKYATVVCGYEDNAESGVLEQFADADSASSWAVHALEWAVTNGVMSGKGENLDPSGNATRAECAAMLRSFCVNVAQ